MCGSGKRGRLLHIAPVASGNLRCFPYSLHLKTGFKRGAKQQQLFLFLFLMKERKKEEENI
jgi:hypothetical protein